MKVVILSTSGTANYDLRIQSQAVFLKTQGYEVMMLDILRTKTKTMFNWNMHNIKYKKVSPSFFDYIHDKIYYLRKKYNDKSIIFYLVFSLILKLFVIGASRFFSKLLKDLSVILIIKSEEPDFIFSRDLLTKLMFNYLQYFNNCKLVFDLHEVIYHQRKSPNLKVKALQFKQLQKAKLIICVTPQISRIFYKEFTYKTIVIPNAPSVKLVNQFSVNVRKNQNVNFLIHGGFFYSRDFVYKNILEAWSNTPSNAYLDVRFIPNHETKSLEEGCLMKSRVSFVKPVEGGFINEVKATRNLYDVGIIAIPSMDNIMYNYCSPNRLATYMHSGLAILHSESEFISSITNTANNGLSFDYRSMNDFIQKVNFICDNPSILMFYRNNSRKYSKSDFNYENFAYDMKSYLI